ncbi:hypothetical protein C8Q79DRAFT_919143 [Trametes meyenii]|nr:hypothetical protein C8Q79DRAFT_919143 [Trametes meyenii]
MALSTLPTEVIELILISTAAGGFPEAIATFSQTCRALRDLVYGPSDQHLWREIFLTTFDDPRVSGGGSGWQVQEEHRQTNPPTKDLTFDWGKEFCTRIWAASYIRRRVEPPPHGHFVYESSDLEELQLNSQAFDALISVISTALPCPPTVVISFLSHISTTDNSILTLGTNYPTFPPLPQVKGGSRDIQPDGPLSKSEHSFNTRNMEWLRSTLARGYPPAVTARFSGTKWDGGVAGQLLDEDEFREMQLAGRLIACTGFIPIPPTRSPEQVTLIDDNFGPSYMSEENQRKRARRLARMRVYNMRYLQRERHWGPFLPYKEKKSDTAFAPSDDDELLRPILALFRMPHHHDHDHDGHEDEDEEDELEDEEEGEASGAVEDAHDDENADDPHSPHARPPSPVQLRPDWAYLAAVRTVVESNLNESFAQGDLQGLVSLEGLRSGSAPWDATQYQPPVEDGDQSEKAKAEGGDEIEGWDWAGVTGAWKRCVCWMDYRDLILHNLSGEFDDPSLGEAVRVISMNLRAESYSPCTVPGYEHLPTIHVEGRTSGASATGQPRRIHGTVGVIADGSVRWSLQFSSADGADVDEWVSEGVQIGGVASAMGVLGMWTGAQHERMDPLGPCWAWKVG